MVIPNFFPLGVDKWQDDFPKVNISLNSQEKNAISVDEVSSVNPFIQA